jgi:excinuclease ABC subunit A
MTGHEWVVTLRFTVTRNTFKPETLRNQLRLTPFHEGPTPVLSDAERVTVAAGKGGTQEVVITCHAADDLETPAFDAFLTRAVASYQRLGKTGALVAASELSS